MFVIVNRNYGNNESVFREHLSVLKNHASDIAYAETVNESHSRMNIVAERNAVWIDEDGFAYWRQDYVIRIHAEFFNHSCIEYKMSLLSVHRNKEFGLYERIHEL